MKKPMGEVGWAGHHVVKIHYEGKEEVPFDQLVNDAMEWTPVGHYARRYFQRHIPSGQYDTSLVINPTNFEPMRVYRVKFVDPLCPDACCRAAYDIYCSIEA